MKEYIITLILLLFDVSFISGHSLSKLKINNSTEVYEMMEDKSSLTIISPKNDRNVLREIIYYHIIEKPYEGNNKKMVTETPALDNIQRNFTNGHGFQYLNKIDVQNEDVDEDIDQSISDEEEPNTDDGDNYVTDNMTEEVDEETETTTDKHKALANEKLANDKKPAIDEDAARKFTDFIQKIPNNDTVLLDVRIGEENETVTEKTVVEEKPGTRKKREIDYTNLPDAPSLPKLNLDILPEYIKAVLMEETDTSLKEERAESIEDEIEQQVRNLERAANHPPSIEDDEENDEEDTIKKAKTYGMSLAGENGEVWNDLNVAPVSYHVGEAEINHITSKPKEVITTTIVTPSIYIEVPDNEDDDNGREINDDILKDSKSNDPKTLLIGDEIEEEDNTPATEDIGLIENPESFVDEIETARYQGNEENPLVWNKDNQKREIKTYGMSLAGDGGMVWNDVNDHPFTHHVGESEPVTTAMPGVFETTTISANNKPDYDSSYEIEEPVIDDKANNNYEPHKDNNKDSENDEKDAKEIEESFSEIERIFNELTESTTSKSNVSIESNKDESNKKPDYQDKNKPTTNKIPTDKETATPKPGETIKPDEKDTDGTNDRKDKNNGNNNHKDEETKQQEFVKELIKNKYFWQWLKKSSTAYLDIMMKKVDTLIKTEVEKQIKQYFKEHKNITNNYKPDNGTADKNTTSVEKPDKNNNITDVDNNKTTTETPITTTTASNKPKNETVVDEKNTANETKKEDLTKRHNNKDSNDKKNETIKIEAQNVYGSSVGNDRVTNIFIFNISNATDFEKFKPIQNGTNGVFIFGLDDKKPNQNKTTDNQSERNSTTTNNPTTKKPNNFNVTTLKPDINKEPNTTKEVIEQTTKATVPSKDDKEVTEKTSTEAPTKETTKAVVTEKTTTEVPTEETTKAVVTEKTNTEAPIKETTKAVDTEKTTTETPSKETTKEVVAEKTTTVKTTIETTKAPTVDNTTPSTSDIDKPKDKEKVETDDKKETTEKDTETKKEKDSTEKNTEKDTNKKEINTTENKKINGKL